MCTFRLSVLLWPFPSTIVPSTAQKMKLWISKSRKVGHILDSISLPKFYFKFLDNFLLHPKVSHSECLSASKPLCVFVCMPLFMYLSLCVYLLYVYLFVFMSLCMYASLYVCLFVCKTICMYVCLFLCITLCMYVSFYVYLFVCMPLCM